LMSNTLCAAEAAFQAMPAATNNVPPAAAP
jgi:hypothetical protein